MKQPVIDVGILTSLKIEVVFHGEYISSLTSEKVSGRKVFHAGSFPGEVRFKPVDPESSHFDIEEVVIGKGFHWERRETQSFRGVFKAINENGLVTAINTIDLEDYLKSVVSSEMSAGSPLEFLKAHAVISRSWLLSQLESKAKRELTSVVTHTRDELIMWFDRESHENYDVCADDHCQRYQGITKAYTERAAEAVEATRGVVLMYGDAVCDARYSKCCGGVTEKFENVWENVPHPYLSSVPDFRTAVEPPDLRIEENAEKWIMGSPQALCNTDDRELLAAALNEYDAETRDFYRWTVRYTAKELSKIVQRGTNMDFGEIEDLIPVERGSSGRITRLKISGSRHSMVVGKELFIRKALSDTHLYSSAFVVEKTQEGGETCFTLHGAGWGHGVGLCQIGAAVMADEGAGYEKILAHYYPRTAIETVY